MPRWTPDPTFYPSPSLAATAAPENHAYVALLAPAGNGKRDGIGVVDTKAGSPTFGRLVGRVDFPHAGNELHHFGWNACSSHLCPYADHAHVERRYLIAPGTNSSRIHVVDTKPDPRSPDYGRLVHRLELPNGGNELHHFGWNACSSHLCGYAPNPHMERRYLVVPGTHSSRIHVVDTQPNPRRPRLVKVIEATR